jgi:hypothetical protein
MLTAIVTDVTTCTRYLPGRPKIDVIQLSYREKAYFVSTVEVGKFQVGQEVEVESTNGNTDIPAHLRLVG